MKQVELTAEVREKTGKGISRQLRREGFIPAIFYGKETPPQPLFLNRQDLQRKIGTVGGENTIFALTIKSNHGTANKMAILKEVQAEPISRRITHSDFYEVAMDKEIVLRVPVSLKGRAKGVELGGILQMATREIEIECLPADIPESIEIDVSQLDIAESIHVRDLRVFEKYRILNDPDQPLVSVVPPVSEEAVAPAAATAEPEAAAKGKSSE